MYYMYMYIVYIWCVCVYEYIYIYMYIYIYIHTHTHKTAFKFFVNIGLMIAFFLRPKIVVSSRIITNKCIVVSDGVRI